MLEIFIVLVCSSIIGTVAYYIGYMTGVEREHDRLCEQWMKENREDNK